MVGTVVNASTVKNTVTVETSSAMRKLKALKKELQSVGRSTMGMETPAARLAAKKDKLEQSRLRREKQKTAELKKQQREQAKADKLRIRREETVALGSRRFELAGLSKTDQQLAALNSQFRRTNMSARAYNMELSNIIRNQGRASKSSKTLSNSMKELRSATIAATASWAAFSAGADIVSTGQTLERLDIALKVVFGDAEKAAKEMAFFNSVVDETGVNLVGATKGFKNFIASSKGSNFNMEEARKIFKSVSKASVALGISADDTEGVFRA